MDPKIRDAYDASRSLADKPFRSACYAPETSLYFNTNGDVIACCKNTTYVLGNIVEQRLDDIWHGKKVKALRKALRQYKFGLGCEFCEWQIKGSQFDQSHSVGFDHLAVEKEDPEWPVRMEFTISNTCNLACVMCYGELSSTIRAQRDNLPPLPKVYDDQFFADLRKYLPHLKSATFMGGEPFLAQENYRVWDMMIEDGISFPCHVITNGTQWGPKVERVLEAFPFSVSISLDGATKETVESIRVNTKYETLIENTKRFREYVRRKGTGMSLNYCLMVQNWHEFGDYLVFGEDLDLDVFVNTVIDPPNCSLYLMEPDELLAVVKKLEDRDKERRYSELPRNGSVWRSALAALRNNANDRQVKELRGAKDAAKKQRERMRPDHISRAWELISSERFEDALAEIQQVAPKDANYYQALIVEAHIHRAMENFDDAERALEVALGMWKKSPQAYIERAWLRSQQDRIEEAVADSEKALSFLKPTDQPHLPPAIHHVLSHSYGRANRFEEALEYAGKLLETRPEAVFYVHRAYVYEAMGSVAAVLEDAERALALEPDHAEAQRLAAGARTQLA